MRKNNVSLIKSSIYLLVYCAYCTIKAAEQELVMQPSNPLSEFSMSKEVQTITNLPKDLSLIIAHYVKYDIDRELLSLIEEQYMLSDQEFYPDIQKRDRVYQNHYKKVAQKVMSLLEKKANPNAAFDKFGDTPLHIAVCDDNKLEITKMLLKFRADVDAVEGKWPDEKNYERAPLHRAVIYGQLESVKLLIEKKAKLDTQDVERHSPLHLAMMYAEPKQKKIMDIIESLIEAKASVDVPNKEGNTPLHMAAQLPLLTCDVWDKRKNKNIWLQGTCEDNIPGLNMPLVKLLLQAKADVTIKNYKGWTGKQVLMSRISDPIEKNKLQQLIAKYTPQQQASSYPILSYAFGWTVLELPYENNMLPTTKPPLIFQDS